MTSTYAYPLGGWREPIGAHLRSWFGGWGGGGGGGGAVASCVGRYWRDTLPVISSHATSTDRTPQNVHPRIVRKHVQWQEMGLHQLALARCGQSIVRQVATIRIAAAVAQAARGSVTRPTCSLSRYSRIG